MSTLFLLLWLTIAGLPADIFAQTTYFSSGTSGQRCGKSRHHCLSTARCNNKRKAICHCKPPLYGNGKIGCFEPGEAVAVLQLDPKLQTFHDDHLNMATPCRYKVIHYSMASFNGTRASAEVYAKNALSAQGEYYVTNVLITISVMTETKVGKHTILLEGNATGGNYKFVTTEMEDSMTQSSLQLHIDLNTFFITVTVDEINNFIVARAEGVGLTVRFRPAVNGNEDDQKMLPGVTMVVDKEFVKSVKFVNGTLSSSPRGVSITKQAHLLGLDVQLYTYYLAILNTPAIIMTDRICQDTTIVFKNICRNDKARMHLLHTCSSLYSDKQFLRCLLKKRRENKKVIGNKLLFRYCVQSFCMGLVNVCQAMVKIIEDTQCQLPAPLRDLQCTAASLRGN